MRSPLRLLAGTVLLAAGACRSADARSDQGCAAAGGDAAPCAAPAAAAAASKGAPPRPAPPPAEPLRPAVTAMLGALVDSAFPPLASAAAPRLACLASTPLPPREYTAAASDAHEVVYEAVPDRYDARLRFLEDPDAALLGALRRPGLLLFHPRRCPPTLETSVARPAASRAPLPPGEDPTRLAVRQVVADSSGAVYADMAVARGARGEFWLCAVLADDLATVRCTRTGRGWTR